MDSWGFHSSMTCDPQLGGLGKEEYVPVSHAFSCSLQHLSLTEREAHLLQPGTGEGSGAAATWRNAQDLGDAEGPKNEQSRPN